MKKNIFAPKRNEVLEAVQPQINKIHKTQIGFILVECVLFAGMLTAIYFLVQLTPALF